MRFLLGPVLVAALFLAACGGDDAETLDAGGTDGDAVIDESGAATDDGQESSDEISDEDDNEAAALPEQSMDYQPTAALDNLTDPQVAAIDEVVPGGDGQSLTVRYQNGHEPCSGAKVTVTESDDTVEVKLETGLHPDVASMTCMAGTTGYEQTVILAEPLGDRSIVLEGPEVVVEPEGTETDGTDAGSGETSGEEAGGETGSSDDEVKELPDDATFSTSQYVGLSLEEAKALAGVEGRELRIARIDDEQFALTMDYVESRVNVEIEKGVVVAATGG